jgi:transposase-like protein
MTATLDDMTKKKDKPDPTTAEKVAGELVAGPGSGASRSPVQGLTTGEISAHFAEIYGASVSKETISRITDKVLEEMIDWQSWPLDEGLRRDLRGRDHGQGQVRDWQVADRPVYVVIGVSLAGE